MSDVKSTTSKTSKTPSKDATKPVLVTDKLVMTKDARLVLERRFVETNKDKSDKVRALLPYVKWTLPEIIAAMHENADKNHDDLVIDSKTRSTMSRSLGVAKGWASTSAADLVDEDDWDYIFQQLSQIADITPGNLEKYLLPEKERSGKGQEWGEVTVTPLKGAKVQFDEYRIDLTWGSGERAATMGSIVEEFLTQRVEGEPDEALAWLSQYRQAVQFVNNEKRRATQAHDTRAASARKGNGKDGENEKGARNQGGTGGKKAKEDQARKDEEKKSGAGKGTPKSPNEKPVSALTTQELIVALTKRVVDFSVALTPADAKAWDTMTEHYEARFEKVPLGKTLVEVTKKAKKGKGKTQPVKVEAPVEPVSRLVPLNAVTTEAARQNAINKGQVMFGTSQQINRALLALQSRGFITAKKRKSILMAVMDGSMNEAQFRTAVAKAEGKAQTAGVKIPA